MRLLTVFNHVSRDDRPSHVPKQDCEIDVVVDVVSGDRRIEAIAGMDPNAVFFHFIGRDDDVVAPVYMNAGNSVIGDVIVGDTRILITVIKHDPAVAVVVDPAVLNQNLIDLPRVDTVAAFVVSGEVHIAHLNAPDPGIRVLPPFRSGNTAQLERVTSVSAGVANDRGGSRASQSQFAGFDSYRGA